MNTTYVNKCETGKLHSTYSAVSRVCTVYRVYSTCRQDKIVRTVYMSVQYVLWYYSSINRAFGCSPSAAPSLGPSTVPAFGPSTPIIYLALNSLKSPLSLRQNQVASDPIEVTMSNSYDFKHETSTVQQNNH